MSSKQTHPFVNIVCNSLMEIKEYLEINPVYSLKQMNLLLRAVDPEKRETTKDYTPLREEVTKTLSYIGTISGDMPGYITQKIADYNDEHYKIYIEYYDRLWSIMWACGYMFDATFRVEIKEDKPIG